MKCRFKGQFRVRVRHPRPWFDSAPSHQEGRKLLDFYKMDEAGGNNDAIGKN